MDIWHLGYFDKQLDSLNIPSNPLAPLCGVAAADPIGAAIAERLAFDASNWEVRRDARDERPSRLLEER